MSITTNPTTYAAAHIDTTACTSLNGNPAEHHIGLLGDADKRSEVDINQANSPKKVKSVRFMTNNNNHGDFEGDATICKLRNELMLLDERKHPQFIKRMSEIEETLRHEVDSIEVTQMHDQRMADHLYNLEMTAINKEKDDKRNEIVQSMVAEIDERVKYVEAEINALDVAGPACPTFSTLCMSKKSLRRRGADASLSMTPEKKQKKLNVGENQPKIIFLLSEQDIADDVRLLAPDYNPRRGVALHKAKIDNGKLVYEGRSYLKSQAIFIETKEYGMFAGIILNVSDQYIQVRSTIPGDPRQVLATVDDLEYGRVILKKK